LIVDRWDAEKYLSLLRCSDSQIKLEFQVPEGTQPQVHLEKQPEIEYSADKATNTQTKKQLKMVK
jgi:hypothetical protein